MNKTKLRIIVYSLLVYLILNVFMYVYDANNFPFSPDISNFVCTSILLISHFALALTAGTMIVVGMGDFTTKNRITPSRIAGSIGFAICFFSVLIPFINYKNISSVESLIFELSKYHGSSKIDEMVKDKNFPLDRRARVSYDIAKGKYATSGILSDFLNEKGETHVYIPTKSEIEQREEKVKSEIKLLDDLNFAKSYIYFRIIFWLSVFFFSIGFSLVNRKNI